MTDLQISIFTTFKPFNGHSKIIQINAIKSWLLLDPKPDIFIFGDSPGSKEIADKFDLIHFPGVHCSASGAPYANMMFDIAETFSKNQIVAYLNGDIILDNTFMWAIQQSYQKFSKFLMIGRRWDVIITEYINYENPNWQKQLLELVKHEGKLHGSSAIEFFVFTKKLWPVIPPFIVGRAHWDNGLMFQSTSLDIPIIDATSQVLVVHQNHDYSHMIGGKDEVWHGQEANQNLKLMGGFEKHKNIAHANWMFNPQRMEGVGNIIKKIKFLEIHTFYPEYIKNHYNKHPGFEYQVYFIQLQLLLKDGVSSGNIITPYLPDNYSSTLVIANNPYLQAKWIQEHRFNISNMANWCSETIRIQIETIQPDILYITDPISFDHSFLKQLNWKPELIIGWRASIFKPETDLRDYDILLSHLSYCLNNAVLAGAKSTAYHIPGFSRAILNQIKHENKKWDFIFTGHAMQIHKQRNKYLTDLANAYANNHDIVSAYFIGENNNVLPPNLPIKIFGPLWGLEMYQEIQRAKIVLNADIDLAEEAGNARLFEVTGIGSFLFTEYHSNIEKLFTPGVEIETFKDSQELIAKVQYYLSHPDEREAIARRGQERCFRDHLMENRAIVFDRIASRYMGKKFVI